MGFITARKNSGDSDGRGLLREVMEKGATPTPEPIASDKAQAGRSEVMQRNAPQLTTSSMLSDKAQALRKSMLDSTSKLLLGQ